MPIPKPRKNQPKDKFLSSCMGNATMLKEYPDQAQRYAICLSSWNRRKKSNDPDTNLEVIDENQDIKI